MEESVNELISAYCLHSYTYWALRSAAIIFDKSVAISLCRTYTNVMLWEWLYSDICGLIRFGFVNNFVSSNSYLEISWIFFIVATPDGNFELVSLTSSDLGAIWCILTHENCSLALLAADFCLSYLESPTELCFSRWSRALTSFL